VAQTVVIRSVVLNAQTSLFLLSSLQLAVSEECVRSSQHIRGIFHGGMKHGFALVQAFDDASKNPLISLT